MEYILFCNKLLHYFQFGGWSEEGILGELRFKKNPRQFIMEGGILGWTDLRSSMGSSNSGGILGELIFEVHNNLYFFGGGGEGADILAWSYPVFSSSP